MARKKSTTRQLNRKNNGGNSQPVSEATFLHYVKVLESKIEYSREDAKDQINGVATGLRSQLNDVASGLNERMDKLGNEIKFTQQALKATKEELKSDMESMETRIKKELTADMNSMEIRLEGKFKTDMNSMESRLTEKIDSIHTCVDDHEGRIIALEGART